VFETESDVLAWYESKPRALDKEFIDSIPWHEVSRHPLNPAFVPVLIYMRDVESFTDIYYKELLRTPTGKDPVIRKFMERWSVEENEHGELLNRFLAEAGVQTSERWQADAKARIPLRYNIESFILDYTVRAFGKYFHGAHMAWGAINEMTTLQGYRRLSQLAEHPILTKLLNVIMKEETIHAHFYWSIAQLKLQRAKFSRDLARFIIGGWWSPVGQGAKPRSEANYLIATLFKGRDGAEFFDRNVNRRIQQLPGFAGFNNVMRRVEAIVA
jgi:rubrerythrin